MPLIAVRMLGAGGQQLATARAPVSLNGDVRQRLVLVSFVPSEELGVRNPERYAVVQLVSEPGVPAELLPIKGTFDSPSFTMNAAANNTDA